MYQNLKRAVPLSARQRLAPALAYVIPSRRRRKAERLDEKLAVRNECRELAPTLFGAQARPFEERLESLAYAVEVAAAQRKEGLWLEFGVYKGETLNMIAEMAEESARVRSTDGGRTHRVRARLFVLAAGGIENARILLLSNGRQPAGIGNQHDNVGRWYMGHPRVHAGVLELARPEIYEQLALYDLRLGEHGHRQGRVALTDEVMASEAILHGVTSLEPRRRPRAAHPRLAARALRDAARGRRPDRAALGELARLPLAARTIALESLATIGRASFPPDFERGWSRFHGKRWIFDGFDLVMQMELSPSRENRVTLGSERDALGQPRARMTVRWTELSRRTAERAPLVLAAAFADAGIGRVRTPPPGELRIVGETGGDTHHHMGATRMSLRPTQGVVDADCRVHGTANVFVAGSSVFPTGGFANPTLTIVALSLRLADHLTQVLAPRG